MSNIISQWYGYYANSYEHEWYLNQVKIERDIAKEINKQTGQTGSGKKKYEPELKLISETEAFSNLAKVYGDRTDKLNIVSTVLLALGILSLVGLLTFWAYYPAPSSNYTRAHNMARDEGLKSFGFDYLEVFDKETRDFLYLQFYNTDGDKIFIVGVISDGDKPLQYEIIE